MLPKELLYFYRIIDWRNKVNGIRPIGYTFFAYLMTGFFNPKLFSLRPIGCLFLFNLFAVLGILVFSYCINDFFDWKIQKEENFLGTKIREKKLKEWQVKIFCCLPLTLTFFILPAARQNLNSFYLFLLFFILSIFYSIPPVRFKEKKFFGVIVPALGGPILFLQGYFLLGKANLSIFLLAILIFLFQFYLELLHIIDDLHTKEERQKMKPPLAEKSLKAIIFFSFFVSLGFSFYNPLFLITSLFWMIRFYVITKIDLKKINKSRSNILSPLLSLYEFLIYGIFGILRLF